MGKDKKDKDKDKKDRVRVFGETEWVDDADALEFAASVPLDQVLAYLDGLREKLAEGELEVRSGDASVTLRPQGSMLLRVTAAETDVRHGIRFDISWDPHPAPELEFVSTVETLGDKDGKSKNGRERASK